MQGVAHRHIPVEGFYHNIASQHYEMVFIRGTMMTTINYNSIDRRYGHMDNLCTTISAILINVPK